ncbi:MAG: hypothetical protein M3Q07_19340 [Pseudobdellovibrionaceae bacterium]|nr:hypothetical protein [Pseudobdellovibrionaceae bacterium]
MKPDFDTQVFAILEKWKLPLRVQSAENYRWLSGDPQVLVRIVMVSR